jgi:hypothetical protein
MIRIGMENYCEELNKMKYTHFGESFRDFTI